MPSCRWLLCWHNMLGAWRINEYNIRASEALRTKAVKHGDCIIADASSEVMLHLNTNRLISMSCTGGKRMAESEIIQQLDVNIDCLYYIFGDDF